VDTTYDSRIAPPVNKTLEEIEEVKSEYRRIRQQFFDRLYKKGKADHLAMERLLVRLLDHAEWLLDVSRRLMKENPENYQLNQELNNYFRRYQYRCGREKELDDNLNRMEELIMPYVDVWYPLPTKLGCDMKNFIEL